MWAANRARRLVLPASRRSPQPFEVLTTRAARAQVPGDAGVTLLGRGARGHQVNVGVERFHGLGASHVPRVGPQEADQC